MDKPYTPTALDDFLRENETAITGEAFLLVTIEKKSSLAGKDEAYIKVAASPMSLEVMRGMILAAAYHHNIQEDSLDVAVFERRDGVSND